jgi:hypothetical protein
MAIGLLNTTWNALPALFGDALTLVAPLAVSEEKVIVNCFSTGAGLKVSINFFK